MLRTAARSLSLALLVLAGATMFHASWLNAQEDRRRPAGPLSPRESLEELDVHPGLALELFAAEPDVVNPTNIDVDARGRVWVTEGVNYRRWNDIKPEGDRIVILEDGDRDGRAETVTVYYEDPSINSALGICVLGNRVFVSVSPHVFVFTDHNGDDRPDDKQVLFRGIDGVQHDHGVHAFVFGPDGRLYFNFGNSGNQLLDAGGQTVVDLAGKAVTARGPYRQGMVFRCDFDGGNLDVLGHNFRNNYEVCIDSFGTLWQSDNDDDGNRGVRINYVMEYGNFGYTDERTGAGWRDERTNASDDIPTRHWHQNDPGVVPNLLQTGAGSPTGICVYEGRLLPAVFHDALIHCDAGPNVVRAYVTTPRGAGYEASTVDLINGRDSWFRPADVCVAPDGSLYVADWYDAGVGGHNMADNDPARVRGRIYRLAPVGSRPAAPALELLEAEGACAALRSPNQERRYLAWQRLRQLGAAAEESLLALWRDGAPRMRARAFPLLARIDGRAQHYIAEAVRDADPNLRVVALRTARSLGLDVVPLVTALAGDLSPQVRRECAIALRHCRAPEAPELWARLAQRHDGSDRWYLEALGIGAGRNEDACFAAWRARAGNEWDSAAGRDLTWRSRASAAAPLLARLIRDPASEATERRRFLRAFDFLAGARREEALVSLLDAGDPEVVREAIVRLAGFDPNGDAGHKAILERLLRENRGNETYLELVQRYAPPGEAEGVLETMIARAADSTGARAARLLLENDAGAKLATILHGENITRALKVSVALGHTEDARAVPLLAALVEGDAADANLAAQSVRGLSRTKIGAERLLALARDGKLAPELEVIAGLALSRAPWREVRREAATTLPRPKIQGDTTLPPIRTLLRRSGDTQRGETVFARLCQECHQIGSSGKDFGPALTEIGDKLGKDALLLSILDPNAGISFDYEGELLLTKDGNEVVGLVISETDDTVVVKARGAIVTEYRKSDILSRRRLTGSIMPSALEASMSEDELVDLVEYLSHCRKPH